MSNKDFELHNEEMQTLPKSTKIQGGNTLKSYKTK